MWVGFLLTGDVVLCTANQSAEAPVPRGLRPDQIFGPQLWKSQGYFGKYSIPYLQIFFDSCKFYENGVKLSIVCLQKPILKVFNSIQYTVHNFCDIFVPRVSEHENSKNYMQIILIITKITKDFDFQNIYMYMISISKYCLKKLKHFGGISNVECSRSIIEI